VQAAAEKWKQRVKKLKEETYALFLAYKHPLTPWYAKFLTGLVVAYAFSPIDLVPDFIPLLGYVDDLILVPLGIALALKMIPAEVMAQCRAQACIDLSEERPVNWLMAVVIVIIWVALAAFCIKWVLGLFK